MIEPVTLEAVRAARSFLVGRVRRTPLLVVPSEVHGHAGVSLFLKLECRQVSGAFKARGANHFLARWNAENPGTLQGVVTYSSGNHGRAVAEAAASFGLPALVTVPDHVDASKEAAIVAAGAEAVRAGATSESRKARALEIAEDRAWTVIPPFDHDWIIAGQGTAMLEVLEDLERLEESPPVAAWVPVGGGGLAAGTAAVLSGACPGATLHTVEPEGAAAYVAARSAGAVVRLEETSSVADGLLPLSVGVRNFATLAAARTEAHTVSDTAITSVFRRLRRELEVACEPSGAVSSTPLLAGGEFPEANPPEPGIHVAIVSGGNIAPARLEKLLG